jgi:HEAT repeat protein
VKPFDETRLQPLIALLLDSTAELSARDDAAIDLGESDDPLAAEALLTIARDPILDEMLHASAGESLGQIAVRTGRLDSSWTARLTPAARSEFLAIVRADRPDLLA